MIRYTYMYSIYWNHQYKKRHFDLSVWTIFIGQFSPSKSQAEDGSIKCFVGHFDVFLVSKTSHETNPQHRNYMVPKYLSRSPEKIPPFEYWLAFKSSWITRDSQGWLYHWRRKSLSTVWKLMKHAKTISFFNKVSCIVNCISTLARCERFSIGSRVRMTYRYVL